MIISIIAAMSDGRVIGRDGKLPWHIPADLTRFRSLTMGHTVAMGRKTFEGIGHPLPGRKNIVVTRKGAPIEGCQVVRSLQEAVEAVAGDDEVFICGGAELYQEALPISHRIYLTVVHGKYPGDVFFPEIPDGFQELHREDFPEATPPLSFLVFEKVDRIEQGADAEELRRKGVEALQRKLYYLARSCFEQALSHGDNAEVASLLAFAMAQSGTDRLMAVQLAEKALHSDPDNLDFHLNLGRVQILAGAKDSGLRTLRKGVQLGGGKEFMAELTKWGTRIPPPIPSLPRNHPLNKYLGILMHRLGLR
jgi:dihydrofolate reductase